MIDLAQCPECGQLVRVPTASRPGRFRCPECEAEFDEEALETQAVPELIPLNEDGQPKLSNLEDTQRMAHLVGLPEVDAVGPKELPRVTRPRPALRGRPKKKMSWELVKIALGGVAGLIIAQLILWWLPGDWRRDPLGLAAHIPSALHFVLPKPLRPQPTADRDSLVPDHRRPGAPADADDNGPLVDLPPLANASMPEYQPSYAATELQAALIAIGTMLQDQSAIDAEDRESRRAWLRQFYQRLCEVAQVATFVNVEDRETGKMMRASEKLLARISNSSELMELVRWAAADWIRFTSRSSEGVALVGEVVQIDAVGDRYNVQLQLPGNHGPIVHVVRDIDPALDPRHAFGVGQQILVLGSILSDPQARSSRVQYGVHLVLRTGS